MPEEGITSDPTLWLVTEFRPNSDPLEDQPMFLTSEPLGLSVLKQESWAQLFSPGGREDKFIPDLSPGV